MSDLCNQCGNEYQLIGSHWSKNKDCSIPALTDKQLEVASGLLMGDGYLSTQHNDPHLTVNMTSPNYLKEIDSIFGKFGNGVKFKNEGEKESHSDVYRWRSTTHPDLNEFTSWYGDKKVWADNIDLTPTTLKHWYCGDGNWSNSGGNNHIRISATNEYGETEKIDTIFENASLPKPSNYSFHKNDMTIQFSVEQSKELWDYMGDPLPDFKYKWREDYR